MTIGRERLKVNPARGSEKTCEGAGLAEPKSINVATHKRQGESGASAEGTNGQSYCMV